MLIPHARYELGRIAHAYCILASLCEAWGESKLAAEYVEEAEWVMTFLRDAPTPSISDRSTKEVDTEYDRGISRS